MTHPELLYRVALALSRATGIPIDETSFPMPQPANPPLGKRPETLCEDEGCDHFRTPHICITRPVQNEAKQ